ncbi:hypothetical Protein YC6258_04489 [Gynuella sunshinyii YC6258]|uniref:Uncharacterized protein n=1 Tax=Gynuella sunshinyii YC6258 TaxID=1445510 RepID=A0A0C5VQI0_9GAMM|nr:hypothetical Protein YC6258_04489 [Gynuella sunshinyii YC6258]
MLKALRIFRLASQSNRMTDNNISRVTESWKNHQQDND